MKRVVTIQDISCIGKCSLTVALPILSSMSLETAIIPTAVLSTHTKFEGFTFRDLSEDIEAIEEHWEKLGMDFEAIYTGYLGSLSQIEMMRDFNRRFNKGRTLLVVDPVMADNGAFYYGFDQNFADHMKQFCNEADVIMPNITEACFLLHKDYIEHPTRQQAEEIVKELVKEGTKVAILTGMSFEEGTLGALGYDSVNDVWFEAHTKDIPARYHGTGDIFASSFTGALAQGKGLQRALEVAVLYTAKCVECTLNDENRRWYGVNFEEALPYLHELMEK
ncbi:MAG: pyridoxamine kinase [Erysipelotrichaceae bacterium]|nr:pyridoxamine kinase [Erysipelotrichaceae bacterium]